MASVASLLTHGCGLSGSVWKLPGFFFFFLIPASACLPFLPVYTLSSPASWSVSCHFTISPFLSCQLGVFQGDFSRKPKENKALKQNLVKPLKRHNFVQCRILKIVLSISGSMA